MVTTCLFLEKYLHQIQQKYILTLYCNTLLPYCFTPNWYQGQSEILRSHFIKKTAGGRGALVFRKHSLFQSVF